MFSFLQPASSHVQLQAADHSHLRLHLPITGVQEATTYLLYARNAFGTKQRCGPVFSSVFGMIAMGTMERRIKNNKTKKTLKLRECELGLDQ